MNGVDLRVTASVGVAGFEPKMSLEQLIDVAEKMMRLAKERGRNIVCS